MGEEKGGNIQKTKNIVVNQGKKKKASLRNKEQAQLMEQITIVLLREGNPECGRTGIFMWQNLGMENC